MALMINKKVETATITVCLKVSWLIVKPFLGDLESAMAARDVFKLTIGNAHYFRCINSQAL